VSRLFLLRHAKAGWAEPGMRDYDRPLEGSGRVDADAMGMLMREARYVPDVTLCSGAVRARETLNGIAGQADTGRVEFNDRLYSDDATAYLDLIRTKSEASGLLVVGHNPMMEDLATALAGDGDAQARAALGRGFATAGLAVIAFDGGLKAAKPGAGYLEAFHLPTDR
jgi:phosphohistidine phosphatase